MKSAPPTGAVHSSGGPSSHEVREEGVALESAMATMEAVKERAVEQPRQERKPHRMRLDEKFKVFSGTANVALTEEICATLGLARAQAQVVRFSDGEVYCQVLENVREFGRAHV